MYAHVKCMGSGAMSAMGARTEFRNVTLDLRSSVRAWSRKEVDWPETRVERRTSDRSAVRATGSSSRPS